MIESIVVFVGAKKDFEELLSERIVDLDSAVWFMEIIQQYNARLRPNESGVKESALSSMVDVKDCIVRAEDYGSVLPHVLSNFVTIMTLNHDIETLYLHNPPKRVLRSLEYVYANQMEYHDSSYTAIDRDLLIEVNSRLDKDILGQTECKKELISGLYSGMVSSREKPVVLMLYGPSGVGKTETAKSLSSAFGGELLRIQFSMMQNAEAYNYIFGAEHSKASFARDLMARETNIILIDEFDKVSPTLYNAFYELFDEGRYVDVNYEVSLKKSIFLCTCNFSSEAEIKKALGPAMYSRIGHCIQYAELSSEEKSRIIETWYLNTLENLQQDEKDVVEATDILQWFQKNVNRYDNIRILKTKLENAVFAELTKVFVFDAQERGEMTKK